jgi:hypothetical protein
MSHPGLSREMDDAGQSRVALDQAENPIAVGDIELGEGETGVSPELRQTRLFQFDVVVIVQIVDADDPLAAIEQRLGDMKTDKPGGTREKNRHPLSDDQ